VQVTGQRWIDPDDVGEERTRGPEQHGLFKLFSFPRFDWLCVGRGVMMAWLSVSRSGSVCLVLSPLPLLPYARVVPVWFDLVAKSLSPPSPPSRQSIEKFGLVATVFFLRSALSRLVSFLGVTSFAIVALPLLASAVLPPLYLSSVPTLRGSVGIVDQRSNIIASLVPHHHHHYLPFLITQPTPSPVYHFCNITFKRPHRSARYLHCVTYPLRRRSHRCSPHDQTKPS
jgi:hypothetical protein